MYIAILENAGTLGSFDDQWWGGKRLVVLCLRQHLVASPWCGLLRRWAKFWGYKGGVEWVLKEGMVEWVVFVWVLHGFFRGEGLVVKFGKASLVPRV